MGMNAIPGEHVQEQAERWFARLLAPDCSAQEREAFERWYQVPEHANAYAEAERLWRRFEAPDAVIHPRLRALTARALASTASTAAADAGLRQALTALVQRPLPTARRPRKRRWLGAVAAGVCAFAVGTGLWFVLHPAPETVLIAGDALKEMRLEDGSRLQLDVGSELAVRYSRGQRAVVLRHGRALFEVAHDGQRPFTVDLGDSRVTVLGTRFQAVREAGQVSVTLDDGALQLSGQGAAADHSERLMPGDQVSYVAGDPSTWVRRHVDSDAATAWSRGRLVFRGTPLAEAVREVNRYAKQPKLRLADAAISSLPVSGNFIAGDSALVASTWAATLPLRSESRNGEIVLHAR